ncbi:LURP-one-related/scramblase family protein [Tengunoibacter tsumagoiensis]|uniref:Tubby C 2 family protein n=1 Tax=Tengunoibacter tsumagoiensis TaxID=2014871 RepID=A0A401ZZN6_9CHLR|nr:LURP-one-related family protein [Tengunoibacter tsumagoiensis]GCE12337.1 hypothetical protein KTT_21960 [Tengunoibacter tsumagoiensis]
MRYHLRERAWSLTEAFLVRDDNGHTVYEIHGKFFHIGDNLVLKDKHTHKELVHIKQHLISIHPSYDLYRDGKHWGNVHEQFHFFGGERFKIKGQDGMVFHIEGDIWNWNFSILDDQGNLMGQVGRQFALFHDSYGVEVAQGVDAPFIIALAVVIEMVKEHHKDRRD